METMGDTMNKKSVLHYAVAAAFLTVSGIAYAGLVIDEAENNGWAQVSQPLTCSDCVSQPLKVGPDGMVTVNGSISTIGDVDFFSFKGTMNDTVVIDIDNASISDTQGLDAVIAVFGPNVAAPQFGNYYLFQQVNDMSKFATPDSGSNTYRDPLIKITLGETGTYTVGVASTGKQFNQGGSWKQNSKPKTDIWFGSYALIVSGVTPDIMQVNIDIKPGDTNDDAAPLNPKSKGVIPVALLSKEGFKPMEVDRASLSFGASGEEKSLFRCEKEGKDLNGDKVPDMVCHFHTEKALFEAGDTVANIKGKFGSNGQAFEGTGGLKTVPVGRE